MWPRGKHCLGTEPRQSLTELAERVGLSLSPCHSRGRAQEDAGVIHGYRAQMSEPAVGLNSGPGRGASFQDRTYT
ncbi:winged helix-turn-helix transcriptional regulator [Pseudomonas eucalypticola]|uniref:Winged helix-turn-helix transcriptional regulator n=1 Tax=Pseudomonas eucalypticola TaxID=2599595 RepID=A0A7D5HAX4_9PSED|nr:winged helix-turn-helix transcriptional regulator [Pseudomonas eucalypticola]